MKLLLDTHTFLWALCEPHLLSPKARALISDRGHDVLVSSASAWEIATKHRLGKLPVANAIVDDIAGWVERAGMVELSVTIAHAQRAGSWSHQHRDPFDRLIAAQSIIEGASILGRDPALRFFGARMIW